jgi:myo-inositol-1(or 4)-monophosphatase
VKAAELASLLAVVRPAAREAAALVAAGYRKKPAVERKGPVDLVTQFDRDSEDLLRERLGQLGLPIVGEEGGGTCSSGGAAVYVDPLDGTTNFVHGHPFWCVSIGVVVGCQPVLGVVVAPSLGLEWAGFVADDGTRQAFRSPNGAEEPCAVTEVTAFDDALLATGFPYDRRTSPDNNFDAFVAIKRRCQAVRRCGSAALDLCLVADGTYEGYWERKLRPWDIAGGAAMVRAAGGRVTDFDGGDTFVATGHIVATNGALHETLLSELASVVPPSLRQPG